MAFYTAFYSYKGGVGRSSALLNVAWLLAQERRVLLIDADIEAPGVGHHPLLGTNPSQKGFVDYALQFAEHGACPELQPYLQRCPVEFPNGALWIMPAGRLGPSYQAALAQLDWTRLHPQQGTAPFVEGLKAAIDQLKPHYVLIDARTGFSDAAGLITHLLAELVVLVFNLSRECLMGTTQAFHMLHTPPRQLVGVANLIPPGQRAPSTIGRKRLQEATAQLKGLARPIIEIDYESTFALVDELPVQSTIESSLADRYRSLHRTILELNPRDVAPHQRDALFSRLNERKPPPSVWSDLAQLQATYQRMVADDPTRAEEYGGFLEQLSDVYHDHRRYPEAQAALSEAVELYRRHVVDQAETFLPELARALINLGILRSELGDREGARAATQEAVDLYRRLVTTRPETFLPDLAGSLNNLGKMLSDLGDREGALAAIREAMELYRSLIKAQPDTFLPNLAMTLNNLGIRLFEAGEQVEAHTATREAVEIQRQLAELAPDTFLPDLAGYLNNLGTRLSALESRKEALTVTQEAVELWRHLVATQPETVQPHLAMSLNNLGATQFMMGDREGALSATREAVSLYRSLVVSRPGAFQPDLARSLYNLGIWLCKDDPTAARAAAQEAIDLYGPLAAKYPARFGADLENAKQLLAKLG